MRNRFRTFTRTITAAILAVSLLLTTMPSAAAQESVKVGLKPVADLGVSGLATVIATEGGKATVEIQISETPVPGFEPGGQYYAQLQAGTCAMPSASSALLGILQWGTEEKATLSVDSVRSVGGTNTELDFAGLTDGDHIISIVGHRTVVACGAIPQVQPPLAEQAGPGFRLGFQTLASYIPTIVGQSLEDEHYAANGDSLQQTSTGLMVWRKADNWTAFTDGSMTWINGPEGLQIRPNGERFDWENDAKVGSLSAD